MCICGLFKKYLVIKRRLNLTYILVIQSIIKNLSNPSQNQTEMDLKIFLNIQTPETKMMEVSQIPSMRLV